MFFCTPANEKQFCAISLLSVLLPLISSWDPGLVLRDGLLSQIAHQMQHSVWQSAPPADVKNKSE